MDRMRSFVVTLLMWFLLGFSRCQGYKDPRNHPNLTPFEQWRSAYNCLQNTSASCPDKYQLKSAGWVDVTLNDTTDYCKTYGCANHTMYLLNCLDDVMRGAYKFENKQTVEDISSTITQGCLSGFKGKALYSTSSAKMIAVSKISTCALTSLAYLSISYINM